MGRVGNKKKSVQYGLWSSLGGTEYGFSNSKMSKKKVKEQESLIPAEIQDLLDGNGKMKRVMIEVWMPGLLRRPVGGVMRVLMTAIPPQMLIALAIMRI